MSQGGAALAHWKVRENVALETGSRGYPRTSFHCQLFPWLKILWVPYSLAHASLWGKKKGKGNAQVCSQEGEYLWGDLCLESFYFSLAGGNLRGGLSGGFQQNIHQFSRCVLSGSWSPPLGQHQGRGSLVTAGGSGATHLVLLLFCVWSWNTIEA